MNTFNIEITETLRTEAQIEASTYEEALAIARKQYKRGEIVLDSDDFYSVDFINYGDYSDVVVYVPDFGLYIKVSEGDGMNLLEEDLEAGYIDYIYFTMYDSDGEVDGGMMLLENYFRSIFSSTRDAIEYVLSDIAASGKAPYYDVIHFEDWEALGLEE